MPKEIFSSSRLGTSSAIVTIAMASLLVGAGPARAQAPAPADAPAPVPVPADVPTQAQTPGDVQAEIDALKAQLAQVAQTNASLTDRLQKIEQQQALAAKNAAAVRVETPPATGQPQQTSVTVGSHLPVTISALLQPQAIGNLSENSTVKGAAKVPNTFRLRRAEIRLSAILTPRITATVMLDPSKDLSNYGVATPAAGTALPTTVINETGVPLQDLYVTYLTHKSPSWQNSIDVGQYKIPLGYEGDMVLSPDIATVDRALMYQIRDPFGGGSGDIRDTGAQFKGTVGQFDYNAGLYNGLGERQNNVATGDPKSFIGRVIFHPSRVQGLRLGLSGARGDSDNIGSSGIVAGDQASRHLVNAFAVYRHGKVNFQNEFLTGDLQVEGVSGATPDHAIQSYYSSLAYRLRPKLDGVVRVDNFNYNRDASGYNTTVKQYTLGATYYISGNNAKIQLDLVRQLGASGLAALGTGSYPGSTTSGSTPISNFLDNRTYLISQFQVAF